ncbi:hypothetical protein [Actinoplanes solisilvae]|uniref:hypothetical protein n=1 Tax=Actinoplanes solisilvae TaxID=2486853 RepID=UPI000FDA2B35|nr:hypothetical protein [Actinoplanes solisilvae]
MSRRGTGAILAVAVTAPLAAGLTYVARADPGSAEEPAARVVTGTAEVTRGTLSQQIQISGTLGYTGSYTVGHLGAPGVLTAAADPGETVGRGGVLYRVSNAPVRLLVGPVPAYRDLRYGMSDGPDVRQLELNLVDLGFDPDRRMTVDRHFTAATAAAIRRWEKSWGRPAYQRTGRLAQGQIVFLPTPLRVAVQQTRVGSAVTPGTTVLTGTSNGHAVIARLDTVDRGVVHVGDQVDVSLPGTDPIRGRITEIGQTATSSSPAGNDAPPPDPELATVPVTIAIRPPRGLSLDEAPVTVDITTDSRDNVLLAPIAALLARPGGGYQVRLAGGGLVPVEPGSFDENLGRVEIVRGLAAGQSVEVPAS